MERGRAKEAIQVQIATKRAVEIIEGTKAEGELTVEDLYAAENTKQYGGTLKPSAEKWSGLLAKVGGDDLDENDSGEDLTRHGYSTSLPSREIEGKKKRRVQKPSAAAAAPQTPKIDPPKPKLDSHRSITAAQLSGSEPTAPRYVPPTLQQVLPSLPSPVSVMSRPAVVHTPPGKPVARPPHATLTAFPTLHSHSNETSSQTAAPTPSEPVSKKTATAAATSAKWGDLLGAVDQGDESD